MIETEKQEDGCPICLEPIQTAACTTACGHQFHSACVLRSVRSSPLCPLCRTPLVPDDHTEVREHIPRIELAYDSGAEVELRRSQRNYDARRRRLERTNDAARAARDRAKDAHTKYVLLMEAYHRAWSEAMRRVQEHETLSELSRRQTLARRRLRRTSNAYRRIVTEHLGDRPDRPASALRETLMEAIQRMVPHVRTTLA
jgi:hypothetical protein